MCRRDEHRLPVPANGYLTRQQHPRQPTLGGAPEVEAPAADEDATAPPAEAAIGSMTKEERRATDERVSSLLMVRVTELLGKMAECDFRV